MSLAGPRLGGVKVAQVVLQVLVLGEPGDEAHLPDVFPHLLAPLRGMASLLLPGHVGPTEPVLVLRLPVQLLQHVALHLPGDGPRTPVLANPLLARDALPQQSQGVEHGEVWRVTSLLLSQHCRKKTTKSTVNMKADIIYPLN